MDSLTIRKKLTPVITKKVIVEEKERDDRLLIQQTTQNLEMIRRFIVESFELNMETVEDLVVRLKETPINGYDS